MKSKKALFIAVVIISIMTSCRVQHETQTNGKATIITTDTTYIIHGSKFRLPYNDY